MSRHSEKRKLHASYMIVKLPTAITPANSQEDDHDSSNRSVMMMEYPRWWVVILAVGAGWLFACLRFWSLIYD